MAKNSFKYVSIYITASHVQEAERIGVEVVERRLAACANVVKELRSIYWWKGKLERDDEALLFLKTRRDKVEEVISLVREIHSYENPAILVLPILGGSEEYLAWLDEELG